MGKVVTSAGMQEFVQTGKHETIAPDKPVKATEAPPLEVKADKPIVDLGEDNDAYDGIPDDEKPSLEELAKAKRFDSLIRKKHRDMKAADAAAKIARDEAAEADRLAESQFNRARLAEQKLAETEAELSKFKSQPEARKPELKEPVETDPEYQEKGEFNWRKFTKAQADYAAAKAVAEYTKQQDTARRSAEAAEAEALARERVAKAEKAHPDYRAVLEAADVKTHNAVLQYLSASEHIGEVSYYLAKNPEFVATLNKLNPLKAIAEIGKLELTFEKPKAEAKAEPVEAQKVIPAPIAPLSSQASVNTNTDPAKMSYKELRAYERSRRKRG